MTKKFQAIPTNLITGFLGSGKTTAILHLLKSRPENSRWAVLVNEFGDVGIDGALLQQQGVNNGVFIKEVPGGCICCTAGLPMQMALNLLIKQANPQRILIEPTGVGHPGKVMDTLTGEFYKQVLDIRATICLLEAHKLQDQQYLDNPIFIDQINIADVLLANKSDLTSTQALDNFLAFGQSFVIPKAHLQAMEFGQFPVEILDLPYNFQRRVAFPDAHAFHTRDNKQNVSKQGLSDVDSRVIDPRENISGTACDWRRFENSGQDYYGCGWIFNRSIVFDAAKLETWVKDGQLSRVKGLFHTNNGWLHYNRSEQEFARASAAYVDDSRVEIIEAQPQDWNALEDDLLNCIESFSDNNKP